MFIQYTIHFDKTQMLKKFSSVQINVAKNALFFLSHAAAHPNFTLNLRFLYELRHKVYISGIVCGIFHICFILLFIKVYIFTPQKVWTLWL